MMRKSAPRWNVRLFAYLSYDYHEKKPEFAGHYAPTAGRSAAVIEE